ncbi:MAG: hypothetical protein ACE5HT_06510 [Gemmatimonadales bacterium]
MFESTKRLSIVTRIASTAVLVPFVSVMMPTAVLSQQPDSASRSVPGFDIDRARLGGGRFEPFQVEETLPLRDALGSGRVEKDTPILVLERKQGRLALVTSQMAYHHIAQGEMAGEPWMVSF